jgi:hypothetical protein
MPARKLRECHLMLIAMPAQTELSSADVGSSGSCKGKGLAWLFQGRHLGALQEMDSHDATPME